MYMCDVHRDNVHVVNGGREGVVVWNINTCQRSHTLVNDGHRASRYVKYLYDPERVLCHLFDRYDSTIRDIIAIMNLQGEYITRFNTTVDGVYPKLHVFPQYLITCESDSSLRVHHMNTGDIVYVFVDHTSLGFNYFIESNFTGTFTVYNNNGRHYVFRKIQDS